MSDHPQAVPRRSLEIRVVTDGAKVHIRGDMHQGPDHVCHSSTREKLPVFRDEDAARLTHRLVQAVHDALCQHALF